MGDGKVAKVASNYRRTTGRFTTRTGTRTFNVSRAPIVLELDSSALRVGFAEQFQPQHVLSHDLEWNQNRTESQWYNILSPWIQKAYDRLMCNPTTRRVVCLLPHFAPQSLEAALKQLLWNRGVPALVLWSNLELLPVSQGWKRGLIVHVSKEEAVCVCHSDGHVLHFTYESVPCGYNSLLHDTSSTLDSAWNGRMDQLLLNENDPKSLVVALLKSLEACPRDIRPAVISNIVFCGEGLVLLPDLGRRVVQRVKEILEGNPTPLDLLSEEESNVLTTVPMDIPTLKPIASKIAIKSCSPYRPDFIAWVGSSLWAAVWNKYDDDESRIQWTLAPTN